MNGDTITLISAQQAKQRLGRCPDCADHDEDCDDIADKAACWLYAPEKGMCPYLRSGQEDAK